MDPSAVRDKLARPEITFNQRLIMDLFVSMATFVQIVESGSLTAAATVTGMSTTMVSNHLQALEARLGMRLLNRTTRRQSLTDFGRGYHERCVSILQQIATMDGEALAQQSVPRGRLRVTAPVSFGSEALMPSLADFTTLYPAVDLDITLSDRSVDLVEDGFDTAIRVGALPDSSLIARRLMPYRSLICAAPAYLARHGTPRRPEDLSGHPCVAFRTSAGAAWRFIGEDGTTVSVQVPAKLQVNNGQALRVAAMSGLGIIKQPEVLLAGDVAAGRLVRLLEGWEVPSRPMHIVYLRDPHPSPKLRSFVDFVIARFGDGAPTG